MKTFLLFAFGLRICSASAQQTISSSGGHYTGGPVQVSANIGEPVIATVGNATSTLTQGFEQPWADITTTVPPTYVADIAINVYPNPVRHDLNIALGREARGERYRITDAAGRLVAEGMLSASLSTIAMSDHASGNYQLTLSDHADTPIAMFRIIVNH